MNTNAKRKTIIGILIIIFVMIGNMQAQDESMTVDIGTPVVQDGTRIILQEVELSDSHSTCSFSGGMISCSSTSVTDKKFLELTIQIDRLDSVQAPVILQRDAIVMTGGKRYSPDTEYSTLSEYVYLVDETVLDEFELHIGDIVIPFTTTPIESSAPQVVTEVAPQAVDALENCDLNSLNDASTVRITYYEKTDDSYSIGFFEAESASKHPVCELPFADISFAAESTMLLTTYPHIGWSDLYLVDANGIQRLVTDSPQIDAQFSPDGQQVVIMTDLIGAETKQLYVYDRSDNTVTQLYEGDRLGYSFLPDGDLFVFHRPDADSDQEYYIGSSADKTFEPITVPADMNGFAYRDGLGMKLIDWSLDPTFNGAGLIVSDDVAGSNIREVSHAIEINLTYKLSYDGNVLAIATGIGNNQEKVELYKFSDNSTQSLIERVDDAVFTFAPDSQWLAMLIRTQNSRSLSLVNPVDGSVATQIGDVSADVHFAVDSSKLVYTTADGEIYLLTIANMEAVQLGSGVATGWYGG